MDALLRNLEHKPLLFVGVKAGWAKPPMPPAACRLADLGRKVLLISTDPAHSLGDVLQTPLSGTVRALTPYLSALELNPQQMVDKHFAQVADTVAAYAQPQMLPQLKQHLEAAKASPGAEEAAMLEAMCRYIVHYRIMGFEQIVFDTAPTGHTLRLLSLPQMMEAWSEGLLAQQGRQQRLRGRPCRFGGAALRKIPCWMKPKINAGNKPCRYCKNAANYLHKQADCSVIRSTPPLCW